MPGGIMDFMLILQIVVLLGAIFLGVRLGGIGIGYAGGLGVLVLGLLLGMKPGNIPWDVILIIASLLFPACSSPAALTISFRLLNASFVRIRSRSTILLLS